MERMVTMYGDAAVRMLDTQYRMHEDIMAWSSQHLYEGKLLAHESVRAHVLADLPNVQRNADTETPFVFIDTAGCNIDELIDGDEVSKSNPGEVEIVENVVKGLLNDGVSLGDIGIITPYNLQLELLNRALAEHRPALEIKSVDGFQGREKEAIIISLVRSNAKREVGFLADFRRMNVAVTRAKRQVVIVGDSSTLQSDKHLSSLVDYMFEHADVRSALEYSDAAVVSAPREAVRPTTGQEAKKAKSLAKQESSGPTIRDRLRAELQAFVDDAGKHEYAFPTTKTARDRALIHQICEDLQLFHLSSGEGPNRFVTVRKSSFPDPNPVAQASPSSIPSSSALSTSSSAPVERPQKSVIIETPKVDAKPAADPRLE